jgi:hypothetical protein
MKLERLEAEAYTSGRVLEVKETADDGKACLQLSLDRDAVLFQYPQQRSLIFANRKRADGILLERTEQGWQATLIELKRTVRPSSWKKAKAQWAGAWHHALALAGVLEVRLAPEVTFILGYSIDKMGAHLPDPVLLKTDVDTLIAYEEWQRGAVSLDDHGEVPVICVGLDEAGNGACRSRGQVL